MRVCLLDLGDISRRAEPAAPRRNSNASHRVAAMPQQQVWPEGRSAAARKPSGGTGGAAASTAASRAREDRANRPQARDGGQTTQPKTPVYVTPARGKAAKRKTGATRSRPTGAHGTPGSASQTDERSWAERSFPASSARRQEMTADLRMVTNVVRMTVSDRHEARHLPTPWRPVSSPNKITRTPSQSQSLFTPGALSTHAEESSVLSGAPAAATPDASSSGGSASKPAGKRPPPSCYARFRERMLRVLSMRIFNWLGILWAIGVVGSGAMMFFLMIGVYHFSEADARYWTNVSIQILCALFTYTALITLPWRLFNAVHLCSPLCADGCDFDGDPSDEIWWHIPRRRRVPIVAAAVLNSLFQLVNQAPRCRRDRAEMPPRCSRDAAEIAHARDRAMAAHATARTYRRRATQSGDAHRIPRLRLIECVAGLARCEHVLRTLTPMRRVRGGAPVEGGEQAARR